jgi:hypothetical protein
MNEVESISDASSKDSDNFDFEEQKILDQEYVEDLD